MKVDQRYSPPWWQTLICLPDDPVKTLVGRESQFFMDYGVPGPRNFATSIALELEDATWKGQSLATATVPVVKTIKSTPAFDFTEVTFQAIPDPSEPPQPVVRYDGWEILTDWTKPTIACDPAFKNAAVRYPSGSHEASMEFHLAVEPGASKSLALGFCEGVHDQPGRRRMIASVEGAAPVAIDPVLDFGPNVPGVYIVNATDTDNDGIILISLKYHPDTVFLGRDNQITDARTLTMSALWAFDGQAPAEDEIVSGSWSTRAALYAPCAEIRMPRRRLHLRASLHNRTDKEQTASLQFRVCGLREPVLIEGQLQLGRDAWLRSSLPLSSVVTVKEQEWTIGLETLKVAPGVTEKIEIAIDRYNGRQEAPFDAALEEKRANEWWTENALAKGMIVVPDAGIQDLVDSCIRNIWQSRDIRNGLPSFHVGPTIYRGLFIADGAFLLEVATLLDRVKDARAGLDYLQRFELPEGGFNLMDTYHKENGLAIFALVRHAQLTQDREWLRTRWKTIEGCVNRIEMLRKSTMTDPSLPNYGLLPTGCFCDGGIMNNGRPFADYSNPVWCLSGLKWAIDAAKWLGIESKDWETEYADFLATFRRAAAKDIRDDGKGALYLPVIQGNGDEHAPARGQWAFCQSVYPGGIYEQGDSLVSGNLQMLKNALVEGIVLDTGWMVGGLWSYFTSFFAHALLSQGQGEEMPQMLYDFANHSSPTLTWREEQKPQGQGNEEVGDMPHNWASAEFLRMIVHMVQLDRGDELHLFEGLPKDWAKPGQKVSLKGIRTTFGRIDLEIAFGEKDAELDLKFLDDVPLPAAVILHRRSWSGNPAPVVVASERHIQRSVQG